MADRFYGELTSPRSALDHESLRNHFVDLIGIEASDLDTDDEIEMSDCGIDLAREDGLVRVYGNQARYGMMDETEADLIAVGVPFDGHSEAKYEFDAEFRWWRPGMETVTALLSNDEGAVLTCVESILSAFEDSAGAVDAEEVRRNVRVVLPDTSYRNDPLCGYVRAAA